MVSAVSARSSRARASLTTRTRIPSWPAPAWGAIGVTTAFIALTCWWLSQDHSVPIFDAGLHLSLAINTYEYIGAGKLGTALTQSVPYPPFAYLVGALGMLFGGVGVAPPVIAENLVFATLLALGCYKLGRLAFNPTVGLLAVVFALGSPLVSAQFRVFMTDLPETSMVAVSVWLIIATDGFSRLRMCALAGVAVGVGMLTKEPLAVFVVGIVGVTAWRGGRRSWRGLALFAALAVLIPAPWYLHELHQVKAIGGEATSAASDYASYRIADVAPPRFSATNLEWYMWNLINGQLYLPLFVFAAVGWVWMLIGSLRRRPVSRLAPEILVGSFVGWLVITETFIHDTRYSLPLSVYLAVFGACWITALPRRGRIAAATALGAIAIANTLGTAFGVGKPVSVTLPGATAHTLQQPGMLTLYENGGFLVAAPERDGDLLGMLNALRRTGVTAVTWAPEQATEPAFSEGGVYAFVQISGLKRENEKLSQQRYTSSDATMAHGTISKQEPPPCVKLDDGTGVWVRLGDPIVKHPKDYCPLPTPHFYEA